MCVLASDKYFATNGARFQYVIYEDRIILYGRSITAEQLTTATGHLSIHPQLQAVFESSPAIVEILDLALEPQAIQRLFDSALYESLRTLASRRGKSIQSDLTAQWDRTIVAFYGGLAILQASMSGQDAYTPSSEALTVST